MSEKGVVDYIDIRVVDGSSFRSDLCSCLNFEFKVLDKHMVEFRGICSSGNSFHLKVLVRTILRKIESIRNILDFLHILDLFCGSTFNDLCVLLTAYYDECEAIIRERGI